MAYICELSSGHRVYLECQETQTCMIISLMNPGQQQQSSSCFQTGAWIAPPEAFAVGQGLLLKLTAQQGEFYIQVQGRNMHLVTAPPSTTSYRRVVLQQGDFPFSGQIRAVPDMQPMEPMQAMEPMQMEGGMQMSPMRMQMGNMSMSLGTVQNEIKSQQPVPQQKQHQEVGRQGDAAARKFCTQCGSSVELSDRFCATCGHSLKG